MTPLALFEAVWERCAELSALQAYLAKNVAAALSTEELLRAEWAARVSALDLYVHERVAQGMLEIFENRRPTTPAYLRFSVKAETLERIRTAATPTDASAAFDLDVRGQHGLLSFQEPDKIADAIRLISGVELWNEVALRLGAPPASKVAAAKALKKDLSLVVRRRNQIVHEGDLQPAAPREPWPISQADLASVASLVEQLVRAIDSVV